MLAGCAHEPPVQVLDLNPSTLPLQKAEMAEASNLATEYWFKHRGGVLAEESFPPQCAFYLAVPIEGFADEGDRIWEVSVMHITGIRTGLLWINSRTKKIIAFGPPVK